MIGHPKITIAICRYHPDKNPDDAEAEEMERALSAPNILPSKNIPPPFSEQFKKINHANRILGDEKKRQIYDKYGSLGLHLADQIGDDLVSKYMIFTSRWFQWAFLGCFFVSGCCFGCCCGCVCCCNFCCGKFAPEMEGDEDDVDMEHFAQVHARRQA